jgi:hypothetical protein
MIKLQCKKCGKVWYTANTLFVPECDDCGGELIELEAVLKETEEDKKNIFDKNYNGK